MDENELRERIRAKAYQLWEEEGCPEGQADAHWDKASELIAIEDNLKLTTKPIADSPELSPTGEPIEPIEAVENAGEFPTMTDQGEQTYPPRRRRGTATANAGSQSDKK